MKKMKPILFSTPMVEAILNDRKTQTRREIKQTPGVCMLCGCVEENCSGCIARTGQPCSWINEEKTLCSACGNLDITLRSKYQVGDILWIRETWNHWGSGNGPAPKYIYRATDLKSTGHTWKPSIFMPKDAARVFLEVTKVRVERLKDIFHDDARAEGVDFVDVNGKNVCVYYNYSMKKYNCNELYSFITLWESINGVGSWEKNPYVWVYDFKQIEKEEIS